MQQADGSSLSCHSRSSTAGCCNQGCGASWPSLLVDVPACSPPSAKPAAPLLHRQAVHPLLRGRCGCCGASQLPSHQSWRWPPGGTPGLPTATCQPAAAGVPAAAALLSLCRQRALLLERRALRRLPDGQQGRRAHYAVLQKGGGRPPGRGHQVSKGASGPCCVQCCTPCLLCSACRRSTCG